MLTPETPTSLFIERDRAFNAAKGIFECDGLDLMEEIDQDAGGLTMEEGLEALIATGRPALIRWLVNSVCNQAEDLYPEFIERVVGLVEEAPAPKAWLAYTAIVFAKIDKSYKQRILEAIAKQITDFPGIAARAQQELDEWYR